MILARGLCLAGLIVLFLPRPGRAEAEVKFDKDFLAGVVEKAPSCPFHKDGHYRGAVQSFRLLAIDSKTRRFLVSCEVAGEFRPPLPKPRADQALPAVPPPEHWLGFRFDIRAGINIEPGGDGAPRFRVEVLEVKRRELEGVAGALAKVLGKSFDVLVTQAAVGRASQMNTKLNAEVLKRVRVFQAYGVFCGIDYAPSQVVLHFDVTRYQAEGIAGYVIPTPQPGTVPLYRWVHRRRGDWIYTTSPIGPDRRIYKSEGIACHVFDRPSPGTVPLIRWRGPLDHFYTSAAGEGAYRRGYRLEGIACHVLPAPAPGAVPLYRFTEARLGLHFYSTHPDAEFAK